MKIKAELIKNKLIIENVKEASRLYNRNHFGKPLSNNKLELDLIEGAFLLEQEKIDIIQNQKKLNFKDFIEEIVKKFQGFEIKYQAYKDLRLRGIALKLSSNKKNIDFSKIKIKKGEKEDFYVSSFSEHDTFDIKKIANLCNRTTNQNKKLWFLIVDEEGDITYYDVSKVKLIGENKESNYKITKAFLLDNIVLIFDKKNANKFFDKEFYGKPFGKGLQLSLIEALYLSEKGFLDIKTKNNKKISEANFKKSHNDLIEKLIVFKDLKNNGLIVKTGFKFGTHFRTYSKNPNNSHAEYLVHVVSDKYCSIWSEVSRGIRLAHSVNKEFIFAMINKKKIDYIRLGRLRP